MREGNWSALYRLVLDALATSAPKRVRADILAAHLYDRPQGFITRATSGLFRQYRNSVSADPQHLIDAAVASQEEVSDATS